MALLLGYGASAINYSVIIQIYNILSICIAAVRKDFFSAGGRVRPNSFSSNKFGRGDEGKEFLRKPASAAKQPATAIAPAKKQCLRRAAVRTRSLAAQKSTTRNDANSGLGQEPAVIRGVEATPFRLYAGSQQRPQAKLKPPPIDHRRPEPHCHPRHRHGHRRHAGPLHRRSSFCPFTSFVKNAFIALNVSCLFDSRKKWSPSITWN
jgi:hypothetical protein